MSTSSDLYENIKKRLVNLAKPKNVVEAFTLPPFEAAPLSETESQFANKYNIVQREVYDVIDKFDLPASQLSKEEKALRIKYLDILTRVIDAEAETGKAFLTLAMASQAGPKVTMPVTIETMENTPINSTMVLQNYDSTTALVKRLIVLLKEEAEGKNVCPPCSCPKCEQTGSVTYVTIVIVLLVIAMLVMYFMKNQKSK